MGIGTKLFAGFTIIIVIFSGVGVTNMAMSGRVRDITDEVLLNHRIHDRLNDFKVGMYEEHDLATKYNKRGTRNIRGKRTIMCLKHGLHR